MKKKLKNIKDYIVELWSNPVVKVSSIIIVVLLLFSGMVSCSKAVAEYQRCNPCVEYEDYCYYTTSYITPMSTSNGNGGMTITYNSL